MTAEEPRLRRRVTAYEFLTVELPRVIREEPKRIRMGLWLNRACVSSDESVMSAIAGQFVDNGDARVRTFTSSTWTAQEAELLRRMVPTCGTVGCIGGWTEVLTGGWAEDVLGLSDLQEVELFNDEVLTVAHDQGTAEHAEAVVRHMAAFAERHRVQLEATVVEPWEGA